jgi:hypothetical protein
MFPEVFRTDPNTLDDLSVFAVQFEPASLERVVSAAGQDLYPAF